MPTVLHPLDQRILTGVDISADIARAGHYAPRTHQNRNSPEPFANNKKYKIQARPRDQASAGGMECMGKARREIAATNLNAPHNWNNRPVFTEDGDENDNAEEHPTRGRRRKQLRGRNRATPIHLEHRGRRKPTRLRFFRQPVRGARSWQRRRRNTAPWLSPAAQSRS